MKEAYIMDERSVPYNKNDKTYKRTLEDDILLLKMVEENKWELKPNSRLADLKRNSHLFQSKTRLNVVHDQGWHDISGCSR